MDFLSSLFRKKQVQLDPDELRRMLNMLKFSDGSDLTDLLALKEHIEQKLTQHEAEQLGVPPEYMALEDYQASRVVVARELTEENVIAHFGLRNTVNSEGQVVYPEFVVPESREGCSEWLARSLNLGVDIFRPKTADITVIIDLIVMDVIQHLPQFQVLDHFQPGEVAPQRPPAVYVVHPGDPPPPPKRMKIRAYRAGTLCMTVGDGKDKIRVVGSYNAAFTCGYKMGPTTELCTPFMATHLIVLKVKRSHWAYVSRNIEAATNELSSYLAMIYHAQEGWYKEYSRRRGQFTTSDYGYGVVSGGEWCRFVYLDSHMMVHRSPVLMFKYDMLEILRYFRCIFDAIVADYRPPPV